MLPVRASEISFGSFGLWWAVWCGTSLSLLTAHLSHFVSDSIHLHGLISSHVAGGCRDSMFILVLKPHKYINICSMPNRRTVLHCWKMTSLYSLFSPFICSKRFIMRCHISFISCVTALNRTLDFFDFGNGIIICIKQEFLMKVIIITRSYWSKQYFLWKWILLVCMYGGLKMTVKKNPKMNKYVNNKKR